MPPHDSGASVVRYTFTARDFHSLLFAGGAVAEVVEMEGGVISGLFNEP